MEIEFENPFSVTKATEYNDSEINQYWVNYGSDGKNTFDVILNPNEYMPKYIIGGKGCGKTHILRYFSYPSQKIRANGFPLEILRNDKYLGIYSVLHGLLSSRFEGKNIENEQWKSIFEYYFELYIIDGLLKILIEITDSIPENFSQELLVKAILKLFKINNFEAIRTISEFNELITQLRNKIDAQILNAAFKMKLDFDEIQVLFSPGDLIFGIPQIFHELFEEFRNVKFIYILDEYEKLFEWQKIFINTLVWDKKNPVTFWIGARRYGYTTRKTKFDENMVNGSEFQEIELDSIIRKTLKFNEFAEELIKKRLASYYSEQNFDIIESESQIIKNFISKFEKYSEDSVISQIKLKNERKNFEYKHINELRYHLKDGINQNKAFGLKTRYINNVIDSVIENTDNNPLLQKYKIFFIYKEWSQLKNTNRFFEVINLMKDEFNKFINGKDSKFDEIKDKRKKDLIVQLCKENGLKNPEYIGFENYLNLSEGNARTLILLLKKTIEYSKFRGENPLQNNGIVSSESQMLAIFDTSSWYLEDVLPYGEEGKIIEGSLNRLTNYLMVNRFCNKPTETSLATFHIKSETLSRKSLECIDLMVIHGILRNTRLRKEKNTGIEEPSYRLSRILCPLWNIPVIERGNILLNQEVANAIFDIDLQNRFPSIYSKLKDKLNAPGFINLKSTDIQQPRLF